MTPRANATQPVPWRSLLAKLVIGTSAIVALADSPLPTWEAEETWSEHHTLDEQSELRFLLTVELAGELYADTNHGDVTITATADRAASDLTLTLRPLTPQQEPEEPEGAAFPEDTFADAGASPAPPDAGVRPDTTGAVSGRPSPSAADRASIALDLACIERHRERPEERPEACVEQFELTLGRESKLPLSAQLDVQVRLIGETQRRPAGTFQLRAEELAP
ncbi:MAG TPA: hypothetical protein VJU61_12220 [Polyangiaceae bacterium]|nr:hypothetical protein [Polyangiaceae bacterium]